MRDGPIQESPNPRVTEAILEVVNNQLHMSDMPEVKDTHNRLISIGYSDDYSRRLIAAALLTEMNGMVRDNKKFSAKRYRRILRKLPDLPKE